MDICQLKPDSEPHDWVIIDRDSFEQATRRKYPWYRQSAEPANAQETNDDRSAGQYAVCPNCDNPVQIVGLYSNGINPYGRHLSHAMPGLADYDQDTRDGCLYYKPLGLKKDARRSVFNKQAQKALRVLIEQFDHVVAILKKETGISFSEKLIGRMLDRFRSERGYLYPGTTVLNIPWMFAYFSDSNSLWWQYCRDSSGLPGEISAALPQTQRETGKFQTTRFVPNATNADGVRARTQEELAFHFTRHRLPAGHGRENMTMVVSHGDGHKDRDIVSRLIEFDFRAFQALMQSSGVRPRNEALLKLAHDKLGDLLHGCAS